MVVDIHNFFANNSEFYIVEGVEMYKLGKNIKTHRVHSKI